MPMDTFDDELDRLAAIVDPIGYQNRELNRVVGPTLDAAVGFIREATNSRDDIEALPGEREGDKQSLLLVYNNGKIIPVVTIWVRASGDNLILWAEEFESGRFRSTLNKKHYTVHRKELTEAWIRQTLAQVAAGLEAR